MIAFFRHWFNFVRTEIFHRPVSFDESSVKISISLQVIRNHQTQINDEIIRVRLVAKYS